MFNQFRTLLMNLPYAADPEEHIPQNFGGSVVLPKSLSSFYTTLFPPTASRFYKNFLVSNYLQIIEGTPFNSKVIVDDLRLTYDLKHNERFFKVRRNSNPTLSNSAFPIFVSGFYHNNIALDDLSDTIQIQQKVSTDTVDIVSIVKTFTYASDLSLVFTDNISQIVNIPGTEISFQIGGNNFTGSSNKTWTFLAEAPFVFDFNKVYNTLKNSPSITTTMFNFKKEQCDSTFENLWLQHPNPVYQMTGLLLGYVQRVNLVWMSK